MTMRNLFLITFILLVYKATSQELPSIELEDVMEARTYNLDQIFGDNKVVVIFVDNDCAYVSHYKKRIEALAAHAYSNAFKVVYINPHEQRISSKNTLGQMRSFMEKSKWRGRYFSDPEQQLVQLLKANKLPEVFIIHIVNNKVNILFKGPIDDNPQNVGSVERQYAKDAIFQIKNRGSVDSMQVVNTMGCRILKF
ncbi:MAG: thioredoxin-related protein [Marivirga sp.]|jgi:thioredoxin-related protein